MFYTFVNPWGLIVILATLIALIVRRTFFYSIALVFMGVTSFGLALNWVERDDITQYAVVEGCLAAPTLPLVIMAAISAWMIWQIFKAGRDKPTLPNQIGD